MDQRLKGQLKEKACRQRSHRQGDIHVVDAAAVGIGTLKREPMQKHQTKFCPLDSLKKVQTMQGQSKESIQQQH
jgi:hypothetical protein